MYNEEREREREREKVGITKQCARLGQSHTVCKIVYIKQAERAVPRCTQARQAGCSGVLRSGVAWPLTRLAGRAARVAHASSRCGTCRCLIFSVCEITERHKLPIGQVADKWKSRKPAHGRDTRSLLKPRATSIRANRNSFSLSLSLSLFFSFPSRRTPALGLLILLINWRVRVRIIPWKRSRAEAVTILSEIPNSISQPRRITDPHKFPIKVRCAERPPVYQFSSDFRCRSLRRIDGEKYIYIYTYTYVCVCVCVCVCTHIPKPPTATDRV